MTHKFNEKIFNVELEVKKMLKRELETNELEFRAMIKLPVFVVLLR